MSKRLIHTTPSGEWGIPGVDLTSLPPRVYGALCKLKDVEALDSLYGRLSSAVR